MIKRIEIENYRSCLSTKFDLHPNLSVLIGPNGCGKTNILRAITILRTLLETEDHTRTRTDELATRQCKLKVTFGLGTEKKATFTALLSMDTDQKNDDLIIDSHQYWNLREITGKKRVEIPLAFLNIKDRSNEAFHYSYFRMMRRANRLNWRSGRGVAAWIESAKAVTDIVESIRDMKYYSASQFTDPSQCPTSFEIEKDGPLRRSFRFNDHTKFLYDLYMQHTSKDNNRYQQFMEIVGPNGIGLVDNINFKEILTSSIDYSVRSGGKVRELTREKLLIIPQFIIGKNELSPSQLSEGTFKTITLLFYLITEMSSILLIEEPEVCVHHGLLTSIIELIKNYSLEKQIIVSTHSDFVLDQVAPENVYKVSIKPESGTEIVSIQKSMTKNDYAALRDYLDTTGNLGEYWKEGALE